MPEDIAAWFSRMLLAWMKDHQQEERSRAVDIQKQLDNLRKQQDRLLNLRLLQEIEGDTFLFELEVERRKS